MGKFLIQKDNIRTLDLEKTMMIEEIRKSHGIHTMKEISIDEITKDLDNDYIPVGTIDFVSKYLKEFYNIEKENPIEIPDYLISKEFLKRDYKIVKGIDLPRKGYYFIKSAEVLKDFTYCGELEWFLFDEMFEKPTNKFDTSLRINKDGLYIVSSNFAPISEYRTYVFGGEIVAISHYDGNPLYLPDTTLLQKAVKLINENEPFLKSYTIDLMVNRMNETAIIEIHNFTSCGIYTNTISDHLPYAYRQGIDYLLKDNHKRVHELEFKNE